MAKRFVARQPKNQRPMINDAYTASVKKKMTYAIVPFIIGALVVVASMGQVIPDKNLRLVCLIVGFVLFVVGIISFAKYAKDLNDYAKEYWEKEDRKNGVASSSKKDAPREKITWAQAAAEYKEEAKATVQEASVMMAEKFAVVEDADTKEKE